MALTAPLSHKWFLKSRKQMRAKAPFKVHLRCLKSIYTHILLRSLLYELLMNSTFGYPTFLIHGGRKNKPENQGKPFENRCTTTFFIRAAPAPSQRGQRENKNEKVDLSPQSCSCRTGHPWGISPQQLLQSEKQPIVRCSIILGGLTSSSPGQTFGQRMPGCPSALLRAILATPSLPGSRKTPGQSDTISVTRLG